jgi:ribosome recycling factor
MPIFMMVRRGAAEAVGGVKEQAMSTDPDTILLEAEESMQKAVEYLKHELRGLRTGRASPAMVDSLKVDYYGSPTELKSLASITCPESNQILIKPFDAGSVSAIKEAILTSGLGLNPIVESKQIRLVIPALTAETRAKLVARARKVAEEQKVALRNVRRDANKHADALKNNPGKHYPEDEIETLKEEIQNLLKKFEEEVDKRTEEKCREITQV